MEINGYKLESELQNANSGFSKWGFATRGGQEYFIKELISPVYPVDASVMTREMFESRRQFCLQFEARSRYIFDRINGASRGNLVRVIDFFRQGSKYYIVSEKVSGCFPTTEQIASFPQKKKLMLMKTLAHCFFDLHSAGIVHFDVKPSNVLIKVSKSGNLTAKLIDFDSGFVLGEPMEEKELGGDLTYLAPETFLAMLGESSMPDEKADIFSLGLVFHEFFTGRLPIYDTAEYEYPYEAILNGAELTLVSEDMPEQLSTLIASMLDRDPKNRPTAKEAVVCLHELTYEKPPLPAVNYLELTFNERYTKVICLSKESITYRNVVYPNFMHETRNFPGEFFAQKKRDISKTEYETIVGRLCEVGLFSLLTPRDPRDIRFNGGFQTVVCICDGGVSQGYATKIIADERFAKVIATLGEYCEFEKIDPAWYDGIMPPPAMMTASVPAYAPTPMAAPMPASAPTPMVTSVPVAAPVPAPAPEYRAEYRPDPIPPLDLKKAAPPAEADAPADPWFKSAGDL